MAQKKSLTLSVALAVFNEEANLFSCLSSIQEIADEIVVVDGGSKDKTVAIAKQFGARVIQTDNPLIFHINKQKALEACRGQWILQLDADEVVPADLKEEILAVVRGTSSADGYYIPRKNYFWGHFMKKGGQYPDYVIRLVRRGKAYFPSKSVHEQIEVEGKVGHLKSAMLHYTNKTRDDYWKKADTYTSLTAQEFARNNISKNLFSYFLYTWWKPMSTFLSIYIRHKGFMDGMQGFEFALYSGLHWAIAYRKYTKA
jgi:glycosyltransferase involved in cell wall biosynthesis